MFLIKDYHDRGQTLSKTALQTPTFWLVLIMTCSIILPWLRLRKVPVHAEVLSNHCVRLHFDYGTSERQSLNQELTFTFWLSVTIDDF